MKNDPTTSDPKQDPTGVDPADICTLPRDGLSERMAWIRTEILPHAESSVRGADGISWELADVPGLAAKLDRLVALERDCCSGIVIEHGPSQTGRGRRLEVRGVDPNAAVFSPLQATTDAPTGPGRRFAKAAGLGTAVSLLVCCALPIGGAALFGAAAAAPLATLDQPLVIAGSALLFGGLAFAWESRRRASAPAREGATGCGPDC